MKIHYILTLLTAAAATGAMADALNVLQVVHKDDAQPAMSPMVVVASSFGGALPRITKLSTDVTSLRLVLAQISNDCSRLQTTGALTLNSDSTVLLDRGGPCSFVQKAAAVQEAGVALMIVGDTVEGAYASSQQTNQAIYNCALGTAIVQRNATAPETFPIVSTNEEGLDACTRSTACNAATCVYTGKPGVHNNGFQVCCFANTLVRMGVDPQSLTLASTITIPAVFVSFSDAQHLRYRVAEDPSLAVQVFSADESPWNVSMLLTWLLGVCIVIGGAYCSATDERWFSYDKVAQGLATHATDTIETQYMSIGDYERQPQGTSSGGNRVDGDQEDDRLELSSIHALFFVIGSSSILILLYYGHLAMLMNILFMVATTASMMQVVILPVLSSLQPLPLRHGNWVLLLVSFLLAALISVYWFVHRASASIWPLQDLLCVTLCFVVIDSIQLPSLKVATTLLGVAFAYDIFFVYISPLIFGSSVMIDVASGSDHIQASADGGANATHEKLPMVLTIPLVFSYYGGEALLGLGDLILPGLFVSFCIRYDYCMGYPLSCNYFMVAGTSYAGGLLVANVMAIALRDVVQGQPALMYIVPIMLGCVMLLASKKNELSELWHGPECLQMEYGLARRARSEASPRREEVESFLKQR